MRSPKIAPFQGGTSYQSLIVSPSKLKRKMKESATQDLRDCQHLRRKISNTGFCLFGCKPQNRLSDSFLRLTGYRLLAISTASKSRRIHLSLLGCLSSVSITSWLYSSVVYVSTTRKQQSSDICNQTQGALEGADAANFPNSFTCRPSISSSCPVWANGYFRQLSSGHTFC